jgi:hypothetical protein
MVRVGILGEPGSLGLLRSEVALLLLGQLEEPYRRFSVGLCYKHNTATLLWYCKHLVHATRGAASSILRLADRDLQDKGRINGAAIGIGHSPQSPWRTLAACCPRLFLHLLTNAYRHTYPDPVGPGELKCPFNPIHFSKCTNACTAVSHNSAQ